ncbi:MAG TPA: GNAT family N-acetyltransferase [Candidatus Limnocylindrales bacterium]|nr:GNAT family N-acetyltransferase [Candidatus Limnocylindrales bacterium]
MAPWESVAPIRTARLELVALTAPFVAAVVAAERAAASAELAARVGRWLLSDSSHVVQLHVAGRAAETEGFPGLGRAIVLTEREEARRVIGTIGFHGPPDERGRLEVSCRIHPAHRSQGYAAEALGALLDWATARYGVTRFLVALPSRREPPRRAPFEIAARPTDSMDHQIEHIAYLLESRPRAST